MKLIRIAHILLTIVLIMHFSTIFIDYGFFVYKLKVINVDEIIDKLISIASIIVLFFYFYPLLAIYERFIERNESKFIDLTPMHETTGYDTLPIKTKRVINTILVLIVSLALTTYLTYQLLKHSL